MACIVIFAGVCLYVVHLIDMLVWMTSTISGQISLTRRPCWNIRAGINSSGEFLNCQSFSATLQLAVVLRIWLPLSESIEPNHFPQSLDWVVGQ